jgi:hypothetical protein
MTVRIAVALLALSTFAGAQSVARRDTLVKTAGAPVHARPGTLVEELSIGVVDGAEEYMFGEVADIAIGNDGSTFVLDRKIPIIRQFNAGGKFVRNVGRLGSGPGEYRSVSGLAVMKDGRLLLWDTGNWRVNVYSATGDFVTQWLTPSGSANSTATFARAIMVDTSGAVWCRGNVLTRDASGVSRRNIWLRVDAGGIRDTVELPPMPDTPDGLVARSANGNAQSSAVVPFSPVAVTARSPFGTFVTGLPTRYAFELIAPGKPITSVRRENAAAQPVTSEERSAERTRIETMLRRTDPNWTWNGPEIPRTKPFYGGISVALDGRIWVAVIPEARRVGTINGPVGIGTGAPVRAPQPAAARRDEHPALYDIFEADGKYVGQVQVPARVSSVLRRGDQVWAVAYDEDDVSTVKRYRIRWQ